MSEERQSPFARGEDFLQLFSKGMEFSRELLRENERLRRKVLQLQEQQESAARSPEEWNRLRIELLKRVHAIEEQYEDCCERLVQVQAENQQFAERYVEIEEENNNLANLYVASYQLHSTLDLDEVLKIIIEVVINLIGAEVFAVFLLDEHTRQLQAVAAEGAEVSEFPTRSLGSDAIGQTVMSGQTTFWDMACSSDPAQPMVCIPLSVQDCPVGAIAIYRLLQHKDGLSALDRELFTVLGGHAATAVLAARLYSQSERKLSTIQGFIDLLADEAR